MSEAVPAEHASTEQGETVSAEPGQVTSPATGKGKTALPSTGLRRLLYAARYSLAGLLAAWRHEAAFRQECALAAILIPAGLWLGRSAVERALLIGVLLLVLVVELLNSAIEAVVDRIGPESHALSGRAKDLGSAAVLMSLVLAAVVWALVAWQRLA